MLSDGPSLHYRGISGPEVSWCPSSSRWKVSRGVWSGVPVLLAAEGPARLRALWSTLGMTSVWGILPTFNGGSWAPDIPGQQDGGAETLLPT